MAKPCVALVTESTKLDANSDTPSAPTAAEAVSVALVTVVGVPSKLLDTTSAVSLHLTTFLPDVRDSPAIVVTLLSRQRRPKSPSAESCWNSSTAVELRGISAPEVQPAVNPDGTAPVKAEAPKL